MLGYSCRSVGDFLRQSEICSVYMDQVIHPWIASLPKWRTALQPNASVYCREYFMGQETIDKSGVIVFPPSMNKQATYLSAFTDCFIAFKKTVPQPTEIDPFGRVDGRHLPMQEFPCFPSRWSSYRI